MSLYAKSRLAISLLALILLCPARHVFAACAIVDDMESYDTWIPEGPKIWQIWIDGMGDCQPGTGNGTGCNLDLGGEITLSGDLSMRYDYDNDGDVWSTCTLEQETRDHKWSVARAEVADLLSEIGSDWTIEGVKLLSVPFHGNLGNAIEDLWIKLEDSSGASDKVYYGDSPGEDPNNMAVESWYPWFIDLNDFEVDLTRIHAISIGVGQEGSTADGGSGTIYFDDIILCQARYGTIYVSSAADGNNTGLSWQDAFTSLDDALDNTIIGDRILVAEGTYYPTTNIGGTGDRFRAFQLKNAVEIYGGFPSTGDPNFQDRDPSRYPTILSGDIGIPRDSNDNCYHVLYHPYSANLNATAILDGFTITAGNANGSSHHDWGGGMYNRRSMPTVINCLFSANSANRGAGMYNSDGDLRVTNCTFVGNVAHYGGGIYNDDSKPSIANCILWGNLAPDGPQIYNGGSSTPIVTYSHVQGGWPGTGNTQGDPLFRHNPDDGGDGWGVGGNDDLGDLRLQPASPCIDAGNNESLPPDADFLGRILDGDCNDIATVDMGAHEFDFTALGDIAEDCDVDANDFAILAARWKDTPCNEANNFCGLADIDRQNAVDFKDLQILAQNWLAQTQ